MTQLIKDPTRITSQTLMLDVIVTASSCFLALRPPIFRLRRDFRKKRRVLKDSANLSCEAPSNIIELLFYTVENIRSTSSHSQL